MKKYSIPYLLFSVIIALSSCKSNVPPVKKSATENSKHSLEQPYVILVSLDGFRWDYVNRFNPPHLSSFIKNGIQAESLIPSFPSKTFPNHYTIATGMYPDKHGLIGNSFYSHKKKLTYNIRNREVVEDGTFYNGTPIWVLADQNEMVSASYFFVGSEANIQGKRPTYYHVYDGSVKNEDRIKEVLHWLDLPPKKRPHIITMYFSTMDDIGHRYGPDSDDNLKEALFKIDKDLGTLFKGVEATELPINIIVVSDHGMAKVTTNKLIATERIKNDDVYTIVDNGAIVHILPKNTTDIDSILAYLKEKEEHFKVYKTENTPGFEYTPKNEDWGAIQVLPDFGYYFSSTKAIAYRNKNLNTTFGVHGYDPEYKEMQGIFYANGPAFKEGYTTQSVKNIHIYPLICKILGLDPPKDIDGNIHELEDVLQ